MARITDIKKQTKNKNRVNLYIDNEFFCGLEAITVAKFRLNIGDEINPVELKEMVFDSEVSSAFDKALHYTSYRNRTTDEIRRYLADGYPEEVIQTVINKLEYYNYVNDQQFCNDYAVTHYKTNSRYAIRQNLMRYCSNNMIIDTACESITDEMEVESACRCACKYLTRNRGTKAKLFLKLRAALYQRGYDYDAIAQAVEYVQEKFKAQLESVDDEE